jgi:pyrroloquinoline quinone biosynthesis protein B
MQLQAAVSRDGESWSLVNASPDLRFQIEANPELQLSEIKGKRNTPIQSIILSSADLDQVLGVLLLREFQPLHLYATPLVRQVLEANSFLRMLKRVPNQLTWSPILPGVPFHLPDGIKCTPKSMLGSLPFYAKDMDITAPRQASICLVFESRDLRLAYTPSLLEITSDLLAI